MATVALVGLAIWGAGQAVQLRRLSGVHARAARFHKSWALMYRAREAAILSAVEKLERVSARHSPAQPEGGRRAETARHRADAADYARKAEYREALVRKYETAARFPWLPVAPDPPEP
jgi:hypothetical protein